MQFVYHEDAGKQTLKIDGELHKYLFKVRRFDSSSNIFFRNLSDNNIYEYKILSNNRRDTTVELVSSQEKIVEQTKKLHIAWCVVDPKTIEKQIASLNELGVDKITFIYCQFSQKQFKINFDKLNKLLINSSQQCGRSSIIKLETIDSLEEFLEQNPNTYMFNFSNNHILESKKDIDTIIIGCEGGFSEDEIKLFDENKIVGIDSNLILRSETAITSAASFLII